MNQLTTWFKKTPDSLKEALTASRLAALQQNIKDALRFLRKSYLKTLFLRKKLPWYVVLGNENTGKTSLLAMSGLHLVSTDSLAVQHITNTTYCQWFFSKEAVFIDTSGSLMLPEHTDTATLYLWKKFVTLLNRHRRFYPMHGVILCIDLLDFQNKSFEQQRQRIDILRHHIQAFSTEIPVYLIFTRCDRMSGFTEFFHMLSNEEREQVCGISMALTDQQNFAQSLEEQFNVFLSHLNQQILACLQRERNLEKRFRIKNFPLQLEAHKKTIVQLNSQLHSTKNPIKGVYFTSSQEEGIQSDALSPLSDIFGFPAEPNLSDRPLQKNAFFIKNTLKKIIQPGAGMPPTQKNSAEKIMDNSKFYALSGGLFSLVLLLMLSSYFYNRQAVHNVQSILSTYQMEQRINPDLDAFFLLNTLKKGQEKVKYANNILLGRMFHQAQVLQSELNTLYDQALGNAYTQKLEKILETQLQSDIQKKSPALFNTLKVYLMMDEPSHRDLKFIHAWFTDYAQNLFADDSENERLFMEHLKSWMEGKFSTFNTNPELVHSAQETLNNLSPNDLVYANLVDKYKTLYLAKNFQTIYEHGISSVAKQTIKDDAWVLGETPSDNLSSALLPQMTKNLQQLYVTRYAEFWGMQLNHIIPTFKDLNAARLFAATFNAHDSPLLDQLNTIRTNLDPIATSEDAKKILALVGEAHEFLTKNVWNREITQALKGTVAYLDNLLQSKNVDETTLLVAQKRMQNHDKDAITRLMLAAATAPEPIDNWLKQFATNTWQTMLERSKNEIKKQWQAEGIYSTYKSQILNRYPVFKDGTEDMDLIDFKAFFGPDGSMDSFFKQNLSAFVDTSMLYWQWKKVDGLSLDIPQNILEMFNRASLIRRMYFANNGGNPLVKFSLTPVNAELISSDLILNLDGQTLNYSTDFRQQKQIIWPNKQIGQASLELQRPGKKEVFYTEKGDWALFKLLAHGNLATSHNPKLYELEFNVNGQKVTYELLADAPINPFIPDILTSFRGLDM